MRTFKFRVWNPNESVMISNVGIGQISLYDFDGNSITEQEGLKIMQYSGLKDKNGSDIYEGDIVYAESGNTYSWKLEFNKRCVVKWGDGGLYLVYTNEKGQDVYCEFGHFSPLDVEVIGNIFENPELLEV